MWLQIVYGIYPNRKYGFYSPVGFWNVLTRVPVMYSDFFNSIDCFAWSKTPFNLLVQRLFYWLLTCVHHIYWISVHLSWNLFSGEIEKFVWEVSKPDIWVWFTHRFVEGCGEGSCFCDFTCHYQYINWIKGSSSRP